MERAKKILLAGDNPDITDIALKYKPIGKVISVMRFGILEIPMSSLYDELCEKLRKDPRLTKRGGPRADLGLLLFNTRDSLRDLWDAAERELSESRKKGQQPSERLAAAVEKLRPIFGERN